MMKVNQRIIRKVAVGIAFGLTLSLVAPVSIPGEQIRVEAAKKDKKKPKIKLSGDKELKANVGEQVTIPATTYSDNKTKKKKLKVGVTVKKGKKNYKALASKIQKATLKSKPVSVTFDEEGTYKITTTVTDLAKNKATATRTVTITPRQKEEQEVVTQNPTTTTEQKHEETKREEKTSEEPKKEEGNFIDVSNKEYVDYNYPFVTSSNPAPYDLSSDNEAYDVTITFENNYECLCVDRNAESTKNGEFIKYLGKITAIDSNGNDVSDTIVIVGLEYFQKNLHNAISIGLAVYAKDSNGKNVQKYINVRFIDKDNLSDYQYIISKEPKVYGRKEE